MSARKGFALPIIIIVILLPIIILAAWAPWVTDEFSQNKLKTYSPCPQLAVVPDFKTPSSSQKVFFGRKLIKTESACGTYDLFVSALGTVHQIKFYKLSESKALEPAPLPSQSSETANPDLIGANWKTYTNQEQNFQISYPPNFKIDEDSTYGGVTILSIISPERGSAEYSSLEFYF